MDVYLQGLSFVYFTYTSMWRWKGTSWDFWKIKLNIGRVRMREKSWPDICMSVKNLTAFLKNAISYLQEGVNHVNIHYTYLYITGWIVHESEQ